MSGDELEHDTGTAPVTPCPLCEGIPRVTYSSRSENRPPAHCGACGRRIPSFVTYEAPTLPTTMRTMPSFLAAGGES